MKFTLRALAGLSVCSMAMAYGANAFAQAPAPAPYPGYQQPAPGYQAQPAPGYQQQPAPGYQAQPAPGYQQQPAPGYQAQPAPGYPQQPAPGYPQQPAPGYAPAAGYQPAPGYPPAAPAPGYGQPAPGYWQPAPGYGAPAPAATAAGPLEWYNNFYGHIGGLLGFHGWGGMSAKIGGQNYDLDVVGKFKGAFYLAGYAPLSEGVHLGGFFNYGSGDIQLKYKGTSGGTGEFDHLSVGMSLKAGSKLNERVWLGFVGDAGLYVLSPESGDSWYGVEVSPRLHLDVLGLNAGGFKMGGFASLGPSVVPYVSGDYGTENASAWLIYITMTLGVTFGS